MRDKPEIVRILKREESSGKLKENNHEIKSHKCLFNHLSNNETKADEDNGGKNINSKYLIDAKRTLQVLINLIPDPVVVVDKKGRFLEISDRVEELTGVRREQLLGTNFMKTKFITAKSKAILIKNFAKRMFGEKVGKYEIEAISKNGEILSLEVNGIKIDYSGKPADLVMFHDISTQKKTEEALRTSEEKWRLLVENIPDIVLAVAHDGNILSINHTVPGITVEQTIGTSVYDYIAPEHCEALKKSLKHVFQTGEFTTYEVLGTGPKGLNTAWYETLVVPAKYEKQITSVILISRDITERKDAEQKIKEKIDELEKFQNVTVDRELKMVGLKKEINELCEKYGEKPRYSLEEDKIEKELNV